MLLLRWVSLCAVYSPQSSLLPHLRLGWNGWLTGLTDRLSECLMLFCVNVFVSKGANFNENLRTLTDPTTKRIIRWCAFISHSLLIIHLFEFPSASDVQSVAIVCVELSSSWVMGWKRHLNHFHHHHRQPHQQWHPANYLKSIVEKFAIIMFESYVNPRCSSALWSLPTVMIIIHLEMRKSLKQFSHVVHKVCLTECTANTEWAIRAYKHEMHQFILIVIN